MKRHIYCGYEIILFPSDQGGYYWERSKDEYRSTIFLTEELANDDRENGCIEWNDGI